MAKLPFAHFGLNKCPFATVRSLFVKACVGYDFFNFPLSNNDNNLIMVITIIIFSIIMTVTYTFLYLVPAFWRKKKSDNSPCFSFGGSWGVGGFGWDYHCWH